MRKGRHRKAALPAILSLLAITGCSTVIGLGDYKVGPSGSESGGSSFGGSSSFGGGSDGGFSGTTAIKPDGGVNPDAGAKPDGGSSSGGQAGAASGGDAGMSMGGTGAGGSAVGGSAGSSAGGRGGAGGSGGTGGAGGACPGGCDDGIACTIDLCDANGCVHTPVDSICGTCMKCDATLGCQDQSTTTELLTNGNFDTGAGTGWTQMSDSNLVLIKAPPVNFAAQTAPNIAWLGVKNSESSQITEPLIIPPGTTALTLSGYARVKSADTVAGSDQAWIDLVPDPADATTYLDVFSKVWFNENAGLTWVAFSENGNIANLPPGQPVWVLALGLNDVSAISDFYFDSLSLKAKSCAP